jgi:hemoglobin
MSGTADPQPYRSTPIFTAETLPDALRRAHSTKAGVWGMLELTKGSLVYRLEDSGDSFELTAPAWMIIEPQRLHSVQPSDDMEMQIDFYRVPPKLRQELGLR